MRATANAGTALQLTAESNKVSACRWKELQRWTALHPNNKRTLLSQQQKSQKSASRQSLSDVRVPLLRQRETGKIRPAHQLR